ncbi:OmpA family protein [Spirosoma utsteinense]|uniref:Outer membrane protein OmpA-like peptidoglycan-associated protein/tetratricopeptide repeat protein n=1 Tax=Spirosoma utsteinense TaxID=2585773 RepID=A0ABR6W0H7_9BACT|nr:OmpA family protein [Spirosoma utsteinense]MBC3783806.1 outer membrane protein OmpA-like peptidoglycan-associated protein/tetratricopeptide repeat protein [Spirosoma utsteinense]MBC3790050.1 outer membrane protein OmpA-like peptidoglycan-associated protein/tetratricopeptide repeat protein [Spirosoma utsteinense]
MRKNWIRQIVIGLLWLSCSTAWAQVDSLLQQADRLLSYKAYGRAIEAYNELLTEPKNKLTITQKVAIQTQLAFAYKQVGDGVKAEKFYRESIDTSVEEDPQRTLNFAQTLAGNGKFKEAQQQYERYLKLKDKAALERPLPMQDLPVAAQARRKGPVQYRLEYLSLNSSGEEFSPAFYGDGLVYVAGSKGKTVIETSGRGGGSAYLDLFYAPNRNSLKASSIINADGTTRKKGEPARTQGGKNLGSDHYTRATANDSQGGQNFEGGISITDGLGYDTRSGNTKQRLSETINSRYHEGPVTFSRDGLKIVFTRNNYNEGHARKSAEGVTKLKLYTARQQNGIWVDVAELPFNSDNYSVGHPALSSDEQLLYFASDMPGGYGGTDLYVSRYENGKWGKPVNLGEEINTKGNELFPFADDDGNLYFSTNGRKGLGDLDIFFATISTLATGIVVQSVEHMDAPVNSPKDDFGLITDANRSGGYFSSNRRDGNDDIYRFVRESSLYGCRDLTVRLYDTESNTGLDSVNIIVKTKGEGRADQTMITDAKGFVRMCLDGDNNFTFQVSRDGYINNTVGFTTQALTDDQPSHLEIGMIKPTIVMDTVAIVESKSMAPIKVLTRSHIYGVVVSERDRRPIEGVTVRLRNECNRSQLVYVTGADGCYAFDLAEGCDYTLVASKAAFGTNTNKIKGLPKKDKPKVLSADLRMLSVGDVVTIDNIYYDLDRFSLRLDAARELDKLVATMRKYPSLIIEIRSHTDSRGSAERNKLLSTQRAKAVANYLAAKGISQKRMAAIGMGESQLVNNCTDDVICTDAEHQRNRRTEFRVVDIK